MECLGFEAVCGGSVKELYGPDLHEVRAEDLEQELRVLDWAEGRDLCDCNQLAFLLNLESEEVIEHLLVFFLHILIDELHNFANSSILMPKLLSQRLDFTSKCQLLVSRFFHVFLELGI